MQDLLDDPKKYGASQIAYGISLFVGGLTMFDRVRIYGVGNLWTSVLYTASAGIAAWGITYAISYATIHILPGLADFLVNEPQQKRVKQVQPRQQNVIAEQLPEEEDLSWDANLKKYLLPNRFFRVRNHQRLLDPNINVDWLYFLAETKWEGDLPHVSAGYLHEYAGISRFSKFDNGKTPTDLIIEFLESFGLITKNGQKNEWTALGNEVFPTSPTK